MQHALLIDEPFVVRIHLRVPRQLGDQLLDVRFELGRQFSAVLLVQLLTQPIPQVERDPRHIVIVAGDAFEYQVEHLQRVVRVPLVLSTGDPCHERLCGVREDAAVVHGRLNLFVRARLLERLLQLHDAREQLHLQ